jgi:hypothetical protein
MSELPFVVLGESQPIAPPVSSNVISDSSAFKRREREREREGESEVVGEAAAADADAAEAERARIRAAQSATEAEHAAFRAAKEPGFGDALADLAERDREAAGAVAGFLGVGERERERGTSKLTGAERAAQVDCVRCSTPIEGLIKKAGVSPFHPDCFRCTACGERLERQFASVGGGIYCVPCAKKKAGKK